MQYTNVICDKCHAGIGTDCYYPGGTYRKQPHSVRVAASIAHTEITVPAVIEPVQKLKEKFTLSGEPLPISTCMKQLGIELDKQDGNHFCFWPVIEDTQYVLIYSGDHWEESAYKVDADTYDTTSVAESEVLMKLIRRYYMLRMKKDKLHPSQEVVTSLSARLLPVASQVQLDALRADIKRLQPLAVR